MTLLGTRAFIIGAGVVLALGASSTATVAAAGSGSSRPAAGTPTLVSTGMPEQVHRLVDCGGTMYAVGDFTEISWDGTDYARNNAFSFSDTAPFAVTRWNPDVHGTVDTIAFNGGNCADAYIGGQFTSAGGATATNIAEIGTSTGALVPDFRHNADGAVQTLLAAGGHLLAGGRFTRINGSTAVPYYASLNPVTGSNDGFADLDISGHYQYQGVRDNATEVYNQQLSQDGTLVLVEGDFTSAGGLARQQIFMINVAGAAAAPPATAPRGAPGSASSLIPRTASPTDFAHLRPEITVGSPGLWDEHQGGDGARRITGD